MDPLGVTNRQIIHVEHPGSRLGGSGDIVVDAEASFGMIAFAGTVRVPLVEPGVSTDLRVCLRHHRLHRHRHRQRYHQMPTTHPTQTLCFVRRHRTAYNSAQVRHSAEQLRYLIANQVTVERSDHCASPVRCRMKPLLPDVFQRLPNCIRNSRTHARSPYNRGRAIVPDRRRRARHLRECGGRVRGAGVAYGCAERWGALPRRGGRRAGG